MSGRQEAAPRGASAGLDLSLCEQEPIHIPGAIQPHGAVLAALADGLLITHASTNLAAILGRHAETALVGRTLAEVVGEAACRALQGAGPRDGTALGQVYYLPRADARGFALLIATSFRVGWRRQGNGLDVCR